MKGRLVLAAAMLALPGVAAAQQRATVGPDLAQTPDGQLECNATCTLAETSGPSTVAPFNGTLTGWHVKQDPNAGAPPLALSVKILRPIAGTYQSVYTGPQQSLLFGGQADFTENQPVVAGDVIGVQTPAGGGEPAITAPGGTDATLGLWIPPLAETDGPRAADVSKPARQLLLAADIAAGTPGAAPQPAQSVGAAPVSGVVLVRAPGGRRFVRLSAGATIPVGSEVDTRRGRVALTTATNSTGGTQTADFYEGLFKVTQRKGQAPEAELALSQKVSFRRCARARASGRGPERHVWGKGKGKFRTDGTYSSAIIRGTTWLTKDTCSGTTVSVREGVVRVRDRVKRRTVTVRAGGSYLARPR